MSVLELGLSIMKMVRMEYEISNLYIGSMTEQMKSSIEYFQEAEDILSFEPPRVRVHILVDRARQRRKEAEELMEKLKADAAKVK